jgi:hypothetical protein
MVDGMSGESHGGPRLSPGGQQFRSDDGSADAAVVAALAAYAAGEGSERAALTALAASRLLVPVVAMLGETDDTGADGLQGHAAGTACTDSTASTASTAEKDSEMALPTLIGHDGRAAIIAFTSLETLSRWRPDARPIPAEADRVWRAAIADECAVVIDVAGPVPLAVEGARLAALADGQPVPQPYEDPDIRAEIQKVIAAEPVISGVRLAPGNAIGNAIGNAPGNAIGNGGDSALMSDLSVELLTTPDAPGWEQAIRRVAEQISVRLARRLTRGIEISAASAG